MDQHQQKAPEKPQVDTHLFGATRDEWLHVLHLANPDWRFEIGRRRLGDEHFKSEFPEFEICSQWQPRLGDRRQRFAVYAKRREGYL